MANDHSFSPVLLYCMVIVGYIKQKPWYSNSFMPFQVLNMLYKLAR